MASIPFRPRCTSGIMRKGGRGCDSPHSIGHGARGTFGATYSVFSNTTHGIVNPVGSSPRKVDFNSSEAQEAMSVLNRLLLPVVLRRVLRARKRKRRLSDCVLREYTLDSIFHACRSSHSIISCWPEEILRVLVEEAVFFLLEPREIIVYEREWYVSAGIVVLLHGELTVRMTTTTTLGSTSSLTEGAVFRRHQAPAVFCDKVVLCRDASSSCIAAFGYADVAVLPARWVWDVIGSYILQTAADSVLDSLRITIAPLCCNIIRQTYFPVSLLLRRSWMWPLFASGDRIRLARLMDVKVFCMGDTIFKEGDYDPYMYIIRRGVVKLLIRNEPLLDFEAGAAFGEVSVIFDEPRCSQIVATTMCEVYCLHRRHLMKYLRKKTQLSDRVVEKALQRRKQWLEDGKTRDLMGLASLLSAVPCLSYTTEKMRICLAMMATVHVLPPRKTLFKKGSSCDSLFVIGRGTLALGADDGTRSLRTRTEFVGELCLHSHLWPTDVFTETSVDGWSISAASILEGLSENHADLQAIDICRQGIDLYRAQHGVDSLVAEGNCPTPPHPTLSNTNANGGSPRKKRPTNSPCSTEERMSASVTLAPLASSSHLPKDEAIPTDFNWKGYVFERRTMLTDDAVNEKTRYDERRNLEHTIETELSRRAGELLSLPEKQNACAADCDFPDEVDDIQQMLVEQALLMPTERLPMFLQQINRSRVTLVVENGTTLLEKDPAESFNVNDLVLPQYVVPPPPVCTLDSVDSLCDANSLLARGDTVPSSQTALGSIFGGTTWKHNFSPDSSHVSRWQGLTPRMGDEVVKYMSQTRPQSGVSHRARLMRSSSAYMFRRQTPRAQSAGCRPSLSPCTSFCSRGSVFAAVSESHASETCSAGGQSTATTWTRSNKVDLSQRAKISVTAFQSALDRLVKQDDQSYFQEMVRVSLQSQMEEHWLKEKAASSLGNKDSLILLLMHVRRCDHLMISSSIESPIVKVSSNSRVLMRTPVMQDLVRPVWPIEVASFISFVRRDSEVVFTVCDADNEERVVYTATLPTSEFRENGGVGMRSLCLCSCSEELSSTFLFTDSKPHIEVCMLAVTASKYKNLQMHLDSEIDDTKSSNDFSTVCLQILGVQGLKHRIEAIVCVSVTSDNETREILRTEKIATKTRNPAWPGQGSHCVLQSDGVVSFDLYHRDAFLASYDTPVDILAFNGTGIYALPLSRVQGSSGDVYGELMLSVLDVKTPSDEETASQQRSKVLAVRVERVRLSPNWEDEEEFTPDPFVILRGPTGEVILRTTLKLGTYNATWEEEKATCFVMCPSLLGCTATYRLEVYDNNEVNFIGAAELKVTMNGTKRNCMQLEVGSRGTLTLLAHSFPLQELPKPLHSSPHESNASRLLEVSEENYLLLIHVSGCDDLQGTGFDDFQIDPVVTARIGRKRRVVAPLVSGCTAPRWSYPKATFVLPVVPDVLSHLTFEVWDTNVELCDVLGVARVSIQELCLTGTHCFKLQPHKNQEFGRTQNFGTITVRTRFGRMNGEVVARGCSDLFVAGDTCSSGLFDSRLPYSKTKTPDLPVTKVRVHVSSCCSICADAPPRAVKVTMSCLQHVLLEVKKKCAMPCAPAWSLEEAHAIVNLRAFYGRSLKLTVECRFSTSDSVFVPVGSALIPFSTLVSASPETVSVRSFCLTDDAAENSGVASESQLEGGSSLKIDSQIPTITISLLALDAIHSVAEEDS